MADPAQPSPQPFSDLPTMVKLKYLIEALRSGQIGLAMGLGDKSRQAKIPGAQDYLQATPGYEGLSPQQIADKMGQ